MTYSLSSAGYTGSRLCRTGTAKLAEIMNAPPDIIYYACGWKFNIFYTSSNQWYGCGDNEFNQMGYTSADTDKMHPLPHLKDIIPTIFVCGDKFTAIVSEDGFLYTMGHDYGRFPTKKTLEHHISFVAAGQQSLVAIPDGPGIYFCETGRSEMKYECKNITFVDAAAGENQFIALSNDGRVFSWGKGKACGQGHKFSSMIPKPVNIEGNPTIARVFAYNHTSFLLDTENHLWAAGYNKSGQAGLGPVIKVSNTFVRIPDFTDNTITKVSVGDAMSYVLTEQGEVFSTGDGDDSRLMQDHIDSSNVFCPCALLKRKRICFISAGCSHVIVATGMRTIIPHPILGLSSASSTYPRVFESITNNLVVDVTDASFNILGFERGDVVEMTDGQKMTIEGLIYSNEVALRKESGEITMANEKEYSSYHAIFKLVSRKNGGPFIEKYGRSDIKYIFDQNPQKCQVHGFLAGEKVVHELLGEGVVYGVLGGAIWFGFKADNWDASRSELVDPLQVHTLLKITESTRTIIRVEFSPGKVANVETSPCNLLMEYGIMAGDIVSNGDSYFYVIGSFLHNAVVKSITGGFVSMMLPSSLIVKRRKLNTPVRQSILSLDGKVVEVDVSYKETDDIWPLDRILTKRGFATVLGKSLTNAKYWLEYDDAYVLNGGAVLSELTNYRLIRRFSNIPKSVDNFLVNHEYFEEEKINPGDVAEISHEFYLVLGYESGNMFKLMNTETKEISEKIINDSDDWEVAYRAGIVYKRNDKTLRNLECQFDVCLESFCGRRVKPGDTVETPEGTALVVGMLVDDVWFKHEEDSGSVCFPPQTVFGQTIKVAKRLGSGLIE